MVDGTFSASYVKLQRAAKFIKELEAEQDAYRINDPLSGRINFSQDPPFIEVHWKGTGETPGAIVGDAIHNMRTALDLMASELARLNEESDRDVYFPFAANPEEFPDAIKRRNFHKAGSEAVALLEQFRPYRGGNEYLRAVHDLDIQDKHKSLILTGSSMGFEIDSVINVDDPTTHNLTVNTQDMHYFFPEGSVFAGKPIIETLKELMELVDGMVKSFAALPRQ